MSEGQLTQAKPELPAKQPATLKQWLESPKFVGEISKALPPQITTDYFARVATTTVIRTPALADCTIPSVLECLLLCAQHGLLPDGWRAYLVPYGKKCTLIVGYRGLIELALRSGLYSRFHADVVCDGDDFEYDLGAVRKHVPDFRAKSRHDWYAVYAVAFTKDGNQQAVCMTRAEVEAVRERSKSARSGPWVTDPIEMAKKTAIRRLSKLLVLSPEVNDQLAREDEIDNDREPITARTGNERLAQQLGVTFEMPAEPETVPTTPTT